MLFEHVVNLAGRPDQASLHERLRGRLAELNFAFVIIIEKFEV
jgi:hypothetical protein